MTSSTPDVGVPSRREVTVRRAVMPADRVPEPQASDSAARRVSLIMPVTEAVAHPLDVTYETYAGVLRESRRPFEVLVAFVPGAREAAEALRALVARGEPLRLIEVARTQAESALVRRALSEARGSIIITVAARPQVEASALLSLLEAIDAGADVAVARRWPRRDPLVNRAQGWLLHRLLVGIHGGRFHDLGCGVRAVRRQVLEELPLYGEYSRFFPLLALHHGYRVKEVPATQHLADTAARWHGPGVWLARLLDLLGLVFLLRFTDKPLRFFGPAGAALSLTGGLLLLTLLVDRAQGQPLSTRPLLLLAVLCLTLGLQAIAFGLIGEMIVHFQSPGRRLYRVKEIRGARAP